MEHTKIRTLLSSAIVAVAVVVGASIAAPHRAAAQEFVPTFHEPWPAVVVALPPSLFVLGMTIADTVSFAEGKRFDDVLAVGDLVTGGLVAIGSLIFLGVAISSAMQGAATDPTPFAAVGGIGLALGGYELAHGIWSLGHDRSPSHGPAVAAAPMPGGVMLAVGGEF